MAAAMNGMALHGGFIPSGATFLVFTDYCRPALRLAALMGMRVIDVMTHDSIGLGEDGPTHQPVEHLAALRAIPNLNVFRPADPIETLECWQLALEARHAPSRARADPAEPAARPHRRWSRTISARRAPMSSRPRRARPRCRSSPRARRCDLALEAQEMLEEQGHRDARRVRALHGALPRAARGRAPRGHRRRAGQGRGRGRRPHGLGCDHRRRRHLRRHEPVSAPARPYKQLYEHFGITAEAVAGAVRANG